MFAKFRNTHAMTKAARERGTRKSPLNHSPDALAWAFKKSGLTQRELAEMIDRSESTVSEMIRGTRNAPQDVLLRIAKALNCPVVLLEAKREQVPA